VRPRAAPRRLVVAAAALLFLGFAALGTWQVQRRAWKHELVERVERRVHAAPEAAPGTLQAAPWPQVDAAGDEYRRVHLRGRFLHEHETAVQAVTERGPGWWLLTPLRLADGRVVLVNRGFVSTEARPAAERPAQDVEVTGLLRLSEPGGGFLRRNAPAAGRWFSRDVQAIARSRGLPDPAPYFVDAEAGPADWPVGGLTVIRFPDNHLVYALTWYGLALMVAGAAWMLQPGGRWSGENAGSPPSPPSPPPPSSDAPTG